MNFQYDREDMNIVIVGHVDHGKSTIIGRLLADTNSLPEGKLEQVKELCRKNSKPFEYAFLLDALKEEQSQGITIDTARCFFKTKKRNYIIIDSPGHIEFLKNMITGASRAEAALLVVDASEGIQENSRRHGYMLSMLGIKQISVVINKMDLVNYDINVYMSIINEFKNFFKDIGITAKSFIPVSGINGDNIVIFSENMNWYSGQTILNTLDSFESEKKLDDKPFRMPVQDVYKFTSNGDSRRIIAGTVVSGKLSIGDNVTFYPSGKRSQIKSIEEFNKNKQITIEAGRAAGFTLKDQIYITRGEIAAISSEPKPNITTRIKVNLFWLGQNPMVKTKKYFLKLGTSKIGVKIEELNTIINSSNLEKQKKDKIEKYDVAECILKLDKVLAFDLIYDIAKTGRFVIIDNYTISGGGIIQQALEDKNIFWNEGEITYHDRCKNLGQKGLVIWLTGLSGSGKSTLSAEVEKELINEGKVVYRLDGDNIRHGLNSDLGFSKEDRNENIRRIVEVAALFKDAGLITIVSCISPYKSMREFAKQKIGEDNFIEIYIKSTIQICEERDPKGLYKKIKNDEIKNFTGITSLYEEPDKPSLIIDTTVLSIEESVSNILEIVKKYIIYK